MPIYTHRCQQCGHAQAVFASVADRDSVAPDCCGVKTTRTLDAPRVQMPGGDVSYECPMTGEVVKSMRRRRYLMESQGVVDAREFTDTWAKTDAKRKADKAEAKAYYDSLPETVKKAVQETAPNEAA